MVVIRVTWHMFNFDARNYISGTAKARVSKFCLQVVSSVGLGMTNYPVTGVVRIT